MRAQGGRRRRTVGSGADMESLTEKSINEAKSILRCRKCRKCVANSDCLVRETASTLKTGSSGSATCPVWHMDLETVPDWVKEEIEKSHWTIGRLNCLFCRARLGAFNFIGRTECPCGQSTIIHLGKSRIDYDVSVSPQSHIKLRSISEAPPTVVKEFRHGLNTTEKPLTMNTETGRLAEALCLEIHSTRFTPRRTKQTLTEFSLETYSDSKGTGSTYGSGKNSNVLAQGIVEPLGPPPSPNKTSSERLQVSIKECTGNHMSENTYPMIQERLLTATDPCYPTEMPLDPTNQESTENSEVSEPIPITPSDSILREDFMQQQMVLSSRLIQPTLPCTDPLTHRLRKRELNKLKSLRRRQRKREKWMQEHKQINLSSDDDENDQMKDKESYICAVCLDVYFNPYMCFPCHHIFCEPCLRTLARDNPSRTSCPLCRTTIESVYFQSDLDKSSITFFPREYLKRKQSFQRAGGAKGPLPSCNRMFRIFGGTSRRAGSFGRRYYPHGAHMLDFEDETSGWRFDMDMIIVYIYSVNWIIGFILFCFICYFIYSSS
uniref:E3 ubiquitin-protein ligase RNF180 n=1 Tax=Leptobrachium leishanense TaxID=445787 RepID=A0A8C5N0X6_9ANUR